MNFVTSVQTCLSKYATWEGRASRSEYFWFLPFVSIFTISAKLFDEYLVSSQLLSKIGLLNYQLEYCFITYGIVIAIFILPLLSSAARRLHDYDKSAWWLLIYFIPLVNIIILIFLLKVGTKGNNKYGADPLFDFDTQKNDLNNSADTKYQKPTDPDAIIKLFELLKSGAITQTEFDKEKSKLLS